MGGQSGLGAQMGAERGGAGWGWGAGVGMPPSVGSLGQVLLFQMASSSFKKVREDTTGHVCVPSPAEVPSVPDLMGLGDTDMAVSSLHRCLLSRVWGRRVTPGEGWAAATSRRQRGKRSKRSRHKVCGRVVTWAVRDRRSGQRSRQAESGLAGWELASGQRLENEGRARQEPAVAVGSRWCRACCQLP